MAPGAAGSVTADKAVTEARAKVDAAEAELSTGGRGVAADALHALRDKWRHATLSAEGAQARAEQERAQAHRAALEGLATEVDAVPDPSAALATALSAVATAAAKVRRIAADHDATLAELTAAATDLGVGAPAPGGPRRAWCYLAVEGTAVVHRNVKVVPVRQQVETALGWALAGDATTAAAEVRPLSTVPEAKRPDHLLRGRNGLLVPVWGALSTHQHGQLRSGDLTQLSERELDAYMAGELGE